MSLGTGTPSTWRPARPAMRKKRRSLGCGACNDAFCRGMCDVKRFIQPFIRMCVRVRVCIITTNDRMQNVSRPHLELPDVEMVGKGGE